ncbi:MAG: HEAT repeat domain-containing protein [Bacteroidales bacterium]
MKRNSFPSISFLSWRVLLGATALTLAAICPGANAQTTGPVRVPPVPVPQVAIPALPDVPTLNAGELQAMIAAQVDAARPAIAGQAASVDALRAELWALTAAQAQGQRGTGVGSGVGMGSGRYPVAVYVESGSYEAGLSLLDNEQWQHAIDTFDRVIKAGKTRVDGAMYWKAYALDRLGKRSEALTVLQELEKSHPNSRWLSDAKALEMEVKQNAGQSVKPEDHANEDLKLLAINSLMQTDPERAVPMLQQVIKDRNSLKVKERALFVLAQNNSPQAREAVAQVARGGASNPDLQMKAVRYLGIYGRSNTQLLADIYAGTKDNDVKREVIRSLMMARDVDRLLGIAKTESDPELRSEAIRQLGMMRAEPQLAQLYQVEKTGQLREEILRSLMMSGNSERMAELARQEGDAKVRASAVRNLGMMDKDNAKIGDTLVQIYKTDKDEAVKKAVVNALFMRQNAKALVDLARGETDMGMKKEIVSRLSMMKSKEATDYMLELLK